MNYGPLTGYELKQGFDDSISHFWNANLSQIYPTLKEMEREGLITIQVEPQEARPPRKVCRITDAGREELRRWLRTPDDLPANRVPFLIKIFFGGNLAREELLDVVRHHLELHRERLEAYRGPGRAALDRWASATGLQREAFYWELTLEAGVKFEQAWVEWCEEAIKRIEAMEADTHENPGR
ncbi:MAG: PadR family transcriptional regulator [Bacillota bacterium]|nr:PadR family transcriptional regulator [Bacillota bacterium]